MKITITGKRILIDDWLHVWGLTYHNHPEVKHGDFQGWSYILENNYCRQCKKMIPEEVLNIFEFINHV